MIERTVVGIGKKVILKKRVQCIQTRGAIRMNVLEEDVNKGPASSTGKNLEEKGESE
jgi:hypothetical protein